MSTELADHVKKLMEQGKWTETAAVIEQYRSGKMKDFFFFRMELGLPESEYEELTGAIANGDISCEAVLSFVIHTVADRKGVLAKLRVLYRRTGQRENEERISRLYEKLKDRPIPVAYTRAAP